MLVNVVGNAMSPDEAQAYHSAQITTFAGTPADLVSALTLNYADEATGIARAAAGAGIPAVISFTVETDGRLPSGQELRDAVAEVDAATDGAPDRIGPIDGAQLPGDRRHVEFDRLIADAQRSGDCLTASMRDQP